MKWLMAGLLLSMAVSTGADYLRWTSWEPPPTDFWSVASDVIRLGGTPAVVIWWVLGEPANAKGRSEK